MKKIFSVNNVDIEGYIGIQQIKQDTGYGGETQEFQIK